jgi:F0F1-type ATP synthase assembly protein I
MSDDKKSYEHKTLKRVIRNENKQKQEYDKPNQKNTYFRSKILKAMNKIITGIIVGLVGSIFFPLFSNTLHWTWIFDYIILALILCGIVFSLLLG